MAKNAVFLMAENAVLLLTVYNGKRLYEKMGFKESKYITMGLKFV